MYSPGFILGSNRTETTLDAVALYGAAELFADREAHLERLRADIEQDHLFGSGGSAAAIYIFELRVLFQTVSSLQINNAPLLGSTAHG